MKKTILSVLILSLFIISCDENSTSPQRSEKQIIKVIDETGNPIPKVEVTFLYNNLQSYPAANGFTVDKNKIQKLNDSNLEFKLYQNMPNPITSSTFLRFSLPLEGKVTMEINNIKNYQNIFSFTDTLSSGLYQLYFDLMDSSFTTKFKNGFYKCSLTLETNGSFLITSNVVLIISPKAEYDLITNSIGMFYVTKEDISWGSSYFQSDLTGNISESFFNNNAYFKLSKEGYLSKTVSLYLSQDEVMEKVEILYKEEE